MPDEFVLANIPELDLSVPIDRAAGLPDAGQIVHRQMVDQRGKLNANGVAYSIIMDTRVGDFTFNAMYLIHKASGMVAMVVHKAAEDKLKNHGVTQPGNSLVKSMLMEYQGAAAATNTTVDASTWQIDFSSRLLGLDRDIQQHAFDHYGEVAFIDDGFLVSAGTGVNEFIVAAGHGYIVGLRVELEQPHSMVVDSRPATLYADVYHAGTLLSDWETILTIKASATPLANYIDPSGYQHYVTPLAQLAANGAVTDLRGRGGLWWHEHRLQAHTPEQVGLDKLENWGWSHSYTDATGGAGKYATGKAVADAYNALNSNKLDKNGKAADSAKLNGQLASFYLAWSNFTGVPVTAKRWPSFAEVSGKPTYYPTAWGNVTGKPAQATRWPNKSEVGLSRVPNWNFTDAPTAKTVMTRNASGDTHARLFRSTYSNQSDISGGIVFRKNNSSDNYHRVCSSPSAVKKWIGMSNVPNYTITSSVGDASNSKFATAGAVKKAYDRASSALSSAANNKVYTGTNAKQTSFPIGHTLTAWVHTEWQIKNANKRFTIYLNTGAASYGVYISNAYPSYRGSALSGTWAYRGYVGVNSGVSIGLFQRVA